MQHNGGDLENMTAKLLEKHITDTIREWQVKIGYEGGTMKLYYPAESLRRSLSLDETEDLDAALAAFCKEVQPRLGTLAISAVKDRYCVEIPEEGCSYIRAENPCSGAPAEPSAGDHQRLETQWNRFETAFLPMQRKCILPWKKTHPRSMRWAMYFLFQTRL